MGAGWDHTTFYQEIELSDFIPMSDFKKFFQRQLLPPLHSPTGSIYTFWYQTFKKYGNYYGPKIKPLILDNEIDIDDWEDLFFSEMKLKYWNSFKLNRID